MNNYPPGFNQEWLCCSGDCEKHKNLGVYEDEDTSDSLDEDR